MPTTLGKPYLTTWRGKPPHMLREDHPVWYRFLDVYQEQMIKLYYDCLLGGIFLSKAEENDVFLKSWRMNTAKRADAIAETKTHVWIVEVADNPGLRAIGQLKTYQTLWLRDPVIKKPERMMLVCESVDPDLLDTAAMNGIEVYIYPADPEHPTYGSII